MLVATSLLHRRLLLREVSKVESTPSQREVHPGRLICQEILREYTKVGKFVRSSPASTLKSVKFVPGEKVSNIAKPSQDVSILRGEATVHQGEKCP